MFKDITSHLVKHWQEYFPNQKIPQRVRPLFMRGDKWNLIYVFLDKNPRPCCIIEISKGKSELLRKAAENMAIIRDNIRLRQFCPRLFYFGCLGTDDMLIQEACEGIPMLFILQRKLRLFGLHLREKYIRMATDLLIRFHSLTTTKSIYLDEGNLSRVFGILLDFSKENKDISQIVSSIKDKKLSLVMSHNDYIPANILVNKDKLKILDWEYATFDSLPLWDLFNFLLWAYRDIKTSDKGLPIFINEVFLRHNCLAGAVDRAIKTYCKSFSIDRELALALFLQWLYCEFKDREMLRRISLSYEKLFCYLS